MVRKALFRTLAIGGKDLAQLPIQQGQWEFIGHEQHEEVSDGKFLRGDIKVGWFLLNRLSRILLKARYQMRKILSKLTEQDFLQKLG